MDRYARGMPLTANVKEPLYYNGEFPQIEGLDLTEIAQMKREVSEKVRRLQADLQKQEDDKKTAEQLAIQKKIRDLEQQLEANGLAARGKVEADRPNNPIS